MRFETPFFALLLLPVAFVWLAARARGVAFSSTVGAGIRPSVRRRIHRIALAFRPFAVVLLVLALMGPRIGREVAVESARGVDLELLLDCSSSMQLRDLGADQSRLDVVRPVVRRFIEGRPLDRIGLLSFALYPRVVSPMTRDHESLIASLDRLRPVRPNSEEDSTAIGVALAAAGEKLAASNAASKVIVMLTDGEERVNDVTPAAGAEYLAAKGIRLYTIAAAGGRGGRATGAWTSALDALAVTTGGRGFVADDATALDAVYGAIDALEKSDAVEERATIHADAHSLFLFAAITLLVADLLVRGLYLRGIE
jgi:Ca-activated chloride channel family protein